MDIDFFGSAQDADNFQQQLHAALKPPAEVAMKKAAFDDHTPNSAKILIRNFHGRTEPVEIDFLERLFGYNQASGKKLKDRAVTVSVGEKNLLVMHPMDCLVSRVRNLNGLKRGAASVAQCRLAINVVRAFLEANCSEKDTQRAALNIAEQIETFAAWMDGVRVQAKHRLEIINAVPSAQFRSNKFRKKRWPQIYAYVKSRQRQIRPAASSRICKNYERLVIARRMLNYSRTE